MNEEKLDTLIKEIEEKFRQIGVYGKVEDFLESNEVKEIICNITKDVLVYIEQNVPESVKELVRNDVVQNSNVIKKDVHDTYKGWLYNEVKTMSEFVQEKELVTSTVKIIKESGIKDIKEICQGMYKKVMLKICHNFLNYCTWSYCDSNY